MKIAVIGTGMVGRTLAGRLDGLGHDVVVGTRDVDETLRRTGDEDHPSFREWQQDHPGVRLVTFPAAGVHGEVVIDAVHGTAVLDALEAVGARNLAGKVVLDLALPLDFSQGMPPTLTVGNTDSLGEQVQRAFPDARVVKALSSVYMAVMVEPSRISGRHDVFVSGDDDAAKATVSGLLRGFGWPAEAILDLGGIRTARSVEMYAPLYFTLVGVLGTYELNIGVSRG